MLCQACHRVSTLKLLCERCRREIRPAPERLLAGGVRLVPAFEHSGPARTLIHNVKYRGFTDYADLVAAVLADRLPKAHLAPVPRVLSRHLKYGVDPSALLAHRLARLIGVHCRQSLRDATTRPKTGGRGSLPRNIPTGGETSPSRSSHPHRRCCDHRRHAKRVCRRPW